MIQGNANIKMSELCILNLISVFLPFTMASLIPKISFIVELVSKGTPRRSSNSTPFCYRFKAKLRKLFMLYERWEYYYLSFFSPLLYFYPLHYYCDFILNLKRKLLYNSNLYSLLRLHGNDLLICHFPLKWHETNL